MAGSVAVAVEEAAQRVLPPLREALDGMKVGPTDRDPAADMGPVVTRQHLDKVHGYIASGLADGASLYRTAEALKCQIRRKASTWGPTIFDDAATSMKIVREEIFGPVLSVIRTDSLDEGIEALQSEWIRQCRGPFHG